MEKGKRGVSNGERRVENGEKREEMKKKIGRTYTPPPSSH
jgi:hypothetical protein